MRSREKILFLLHDCAQRGKIFLNKPSQDPPSLIQAGPDTKCDTPPLDVTFLRFMSRHFTSLHFTSHFFANFCDFLRFSWILAPETEGFGGRFSPKCCFIRENGDFVKIELPPRREHDFQGSERRTIDKKSKKNRCENCCEK